MRNLNIVLIAITAVLTMQGKTVITESPAGRTADGATLTFYHLKNEKLEATILNFGGRLVSLKVPDRAGKVDDVVLGFDDGARYTTANPYFGALIGRYANRIGRGQFTLEGKPYTLAKNNGANALHGGLLGFDKRIWTAKIAGQVLELRYASKDGEEGYPGNMAVVVRYSLEDSAIKIDYSATSDATTVVNLTNHSYFNLAGAGQGTVFDHELTIAADRFLPVDEGLIPTGEFKNVAGTPFDFRTPHKIGERIAAADPQIKLGLGYDHNFVLNAGGPALHLAARVREPRSGRVMEVTTTEPGVQFYSANRLNGEVVGKGGKAYPQFGAFCLETQHFPDSPNHPDFPSVVLKKGTPFHSTTIYRFSIQ